MHQNLPCTQREAFERIALASQMMYICGRAAPAIREIPPLLQVCVCQKEADRVPQEVRQERMDREFGGQRNHEDGDG